MRLRNIIGLVLLCSLVLLIGLQVLIGHFVVYPGFTRIEKQIARDDANRCIEAITREVYHLNILTKDWAIWDDSYEFIEDLNESYSNSNLNGESFTINNLHLMYFVNVRGEIVWHRIENAEETLSTEQLDSVHQSLIQLTEYLLSEESLAGLIATEVGPLLIASCGIYDSEESRPCRGRLVMGRFLNQSTISELVRQTHVNFEILPVNSKTETDPPWTRELEANKHAIKTLPSYLSVSTLYSDLYGKTAYIVCSETKRDIARAGKSVMIYTIIASVAGAVLFAFFLSTTLNFSISKPIASLTTQIRKLKEKNNMSHQSIEVTRGFEAQLLAKEFNCLMHQLDNNHQQRLEVEEQLKKTIQQVKLANRSKSDFLANMSHEIRTPMNAIIGFIQLLREEELTETQKDYLQTITVSAEALLNLINDILDMSKIDSGNLTIESIDCSLDEQVDFLTRFIHPLALDKALDFRVSVAAEVPKTIKTDPLRLRQCLINLLGNAIKFTREGHVGLNIYTLQEDENTSICFAVEDTGTGIAPDRQANIFDAFIQADGSTTRKYGGTGLGLSITQKLAVLMDGSIQLQSKPNVGSVFTLILPLVPQTSRPQEIGTTLS